MKICSQCGLRLMGHATTCPVDGAPLVAMPDPLIGRTIGGRYRIESKIGAGGMASVYRASNDVLGRKVAIKFLAPDLAQDATQRQRFLREARATNRIRHEHIVDITDYGDEGKLVYLVMELLEGEPLNHRIARGPIPPREAIELLMQVARALARAHELEVIHRDLKPENIFLTVRDGHTHIKLLDFGLAHVRNETRLTAAGAVFGTPEYLSPEQARGAPNVGPAADLYALGVVFFEMLTGRLPFEGSTAELIVKHLRNAPPAPSQFNPSVPPEIDALVAKLLSKDPAQRHRDAYHLLEELQALLALFPDPNNLPTPVVSLTLPAEAFVEALAKVSQERNSASDEERASPEHPTTVMSTARQWVERRLVYREAMGLAYPSRNAPDWLMNLSAKMDALVDRSVRTESELDRLGRQLAEREAEASGARERIGRALDELSRDESALKRQIEDVHRRLERATQRATQGAQEFKLAWDEARTLVGDGALEQLEAAQSVETAARRATAWRQAQLEVVECRALLESRTASAEDLRFQVSQLKGRLGALNAEVEHEIGKLRERVAEIGGQNATIFEELHEVASEIGGHLSEFPSARRVLQTTAAVPKPVEIT
ncbi:MAG: protein kinase [Polyangiales bacterium]